MDSIDSISTPPSKLLPTVPDLDPISEPDQIPSFSVVEIALPAEPKPKTPSSNPALPLRELLLLSPSSPARRSARIRLSDRLEAGEDEAIGGRRRCRAKTSSIASPRNARRPRRRIEVEAREEMLSPPVVEQKKRRCNGRPKKDKVDVIVVPPSVDCLKEKEGDQCAALYVMGQLMNDLIMWRDVAKSSLWFGFGALFIFSSCFTRGLNFSFFSVASHMGLLYLGVSFLSTTLLQRKNVEKVGECKVKEEDILRLARVVLPPINLFLSKCAVLFSGEPSITLKVAICFLIGAEYGHLLTLQRLCVIGFFASFSIPKLYSLYATKIDAIVESGKSRVLETWQSCPRKKAVVALVTTAFWNMSSVKTRTFVAFLSLVILRYVRQNSQVSSEGGGGGEEAISEDPVEKKLQ